MQYINNLFLPSNPNPTVDVGNHVYRHRDAQDGLVKSPIFPRLKDNECTIYHVWNEVSTANAHKPGFGHRELIKVRRKEFFIMCVPPYIFQSIQIFIDQFFF